MKRVLNGDEFTELAAQYIDVDPATFRPRCVLIRDLDPLQRFELTELLEDLGVPGSGQYLDRLLTVDDAYVVYATHLRSVPSTRR